MTSPQETETHDVTLSREERWIVHHVLTARADDVLDDGESPPEWMVDSFETLESGSETFTRSQTRHLSDALQTYANEDETPGEDATLASSIADQFEAALEAS